MNGPSNSSLADTQLPLCRTQLKPFFEASLPSDFVVNPHWSSSKSHLIVPMVLYKIKRNYNRFGSIVVICINILDTVYKILTIVGFQSCRGRRSCWTRGGGRWCSRWSFSSSCCRWWNCRRGGFGIGRCKFAEFKYFELYVIDCNIPMTIFSTLNDKLKLQKISLLKLSKHSLPQLKNEYL